MLEAAERVESEIDAGDPLNGAGSLGRSHSRYTHQKSGPVVAGNVSEDVFSGGESRVERADGNACAARDIRHAYVLELLLAQQGKRRVYKVIEYVLRSLLFWPGDDSWKPEPCSDVIGALPREKVRAACHCDRPLAVGVVFARDSAVTFCASKEARSKIRGFP